MLMRGTSEYSMHSHPFTLLQIVISDSQGNPIWKPMWLIVMGKERNQLSILDCYDAYRQRYFRASIFFVLVSKDY